MSSTLTVAPELQVSAWLNTPTPLSLAQLRGKVVAIYAFQMLCPACVMHSIPQASAIGNIFSENDVAVIGLHTVFEHHDVMNQSALEAFIHEYRISFPVAIDMPSANGPLPLTMERYRLRGTPSILLIDKAGCLRFNHFGRVEDMHVGAVIGGLLADRTDGKIIAADGVADPARTRAGCDDTACDIA